MTVRESESRILTLPTHYYRPNMKGKTVIFRELITSVTPFMNEDTKDVILNIMSINPLVKEISGQ